MKAVPQITFFLLAACLLSCLQGHADLDGHQVPRIFHPLRRERRKVVAWQEKQSIRPDAYWNLLRIESCRLTPPGKGLGFRATESDEISGVGVVVSSTSQQNSLDCAPRSFRVLPGEPMRLVLTVQTHSACSIRWDVPSEPRILVRAVEKFPVRRNDKGMFVYQRAILWQALEPGRVLIETLSVEMDGRKQRFPKVSITIDDLGP